MNKNQKGFTVIEIALILVLVILIGVVGWLVYKDHHKKVYTVNKTANKTASPISPKPPANPYAGWKSYTLSKEKLSIKYPSDWKLTDSTDPNSTGDNLVLVSPNNFNMTIVDGQYDFNEPDGGLTIDQADQITFVGQKAYLVLTEPGNQNTGSINSINLTNSNSQVGLATFIPTKNTNSKLNIDMHYLDNNGNYVSKSVASVENDTDYKNAKLLIESATY